MNCEYCNKQFVENENCMVEFLTHTIVIHGENVN